MSSIEKRPINTRELTSEEQESIERIDSIAPPETPKTPEEAPVGDAGIGTEDVSELKKLGIVSAGEDIGTSLKELSLLERTLGPEYANFFEVADLKAIRRLFDEHMGDLLSDEASKEDRGELLISTIRQIADRIKEKYGASDWSHLEPDGRATVVAVVAEEIFQKGKK